MVRFVDTDDLEKLAQAYASILEQVFLSIFTNEWVDDYMGFALYALSEKKDTDLFLAIEDQTEASEQSEAVDPMLAAKCFFMYAWNLFKNTCSENRIVIGARQVRELLTCYVPGSKIIWEDLIDLIVELEDFRRMARSQIADYLDEQESQKRLTQESHSARIEALIPTRMIKTRQAQRPDMTEANFAIEIVGLVDIIVKMEIPCTVKDLQGILKNKIPLLQYYQLQSISRYEEQLKKTQQVKNQQNGDAERSFDPEKIIKHLVSPSLDPIDCVVSFDTENVCLYVRGKEFSLGYKKGNDFKDFMRALHEILEITPPIFYQKRLKEFLDLLEDNAKRFGHFDVFATFVFKAFKIHKEKQLEVMNNLKNYDIKWEIRFPILVAVLGMKHTRHIDQGIFAQT